MDITFPEHKNTCHCEDVAGERPFQSGGHSLPLLINPEQPGDGEGRLYQAFIAVLSVLQPCIYTSIESTLVGVSITKL